MFTFGPQAGQMLLFKSGPPPSSDKYKSPSTTTASSSSSSSSSSSAHLSSSIPTATLTVERTKHNTPSPYRILQFASHRTFMRLEQDSSPENVLRCSRLYRKQLQQAEEQLSNIIWQDEEEQEYNYTTSTEQPEEREPSLPLETYFKRCFARQTKNEGRAFEILQDNLESLTSYLQLTEIVWNLCELLHLESSAKPISSQVVRWVQKFEAYVFGNLPIAFNDDETTEDHLDKYLMEEGLKNNDTFFNVRYYVTHGMFKDAARACTVKKRTGGMNKNEYELLDELVHLLQQRNDLSAGFTSTGARGFKRKQQRNWDDWKHQVSLGKKKIENNANGIGVNSIEEDIVWIFDLMLNGKNNFADKDVYLNRTWMSDVLLELSYNQPNAVAHEVVRTMHKCFDNANDPEEIANNETYIDLRALLRECLYSTRLPVVLKYLDEEGYETINMQVENENNTNEMLNISGGITAPWSVAHFSDVLFKRNILLDVPVDSSLESKPELVQLALEKSPNLRDMYVEQYACSLQRGCGADMAADYLGTCSFQQRCNHPRMRDMLTRSYSKTDRETEKIVHIATKYNLTSVVEDVCASRAAYWKQRGRTAQSLQWLSKCNDQGSKLSNAIRALLQQGPHATDYTMLDTLLQGLNVVGGERNSLPLRKTMPRRNNDGPIVFLSNYHETCVVLRNAEDLNSSIETNTPQLDEHSLKLAKGNLHFLEAEASKRLAELLCNVSCNEHPSFWLPLLTQLEPFVYRRPPVITASDSRRVLRRIEEISTSWNKDDFLPPVMPPWEQVQIAIISIFQTWQLKNNTQTVSAGPQHSFVIKGDQYVSLRDSIPILPSPELLGNIDFVDNIESVITEEHLKSVYNKARKKAFNYKSSTEGESGLVPRMRWALAENLACSLGVAHREQQHDPVGGGGGVGGMTGFARPSKHQKL